MNRRHTLMPIAVLALAPFALLIAQQRAGGPAEKQAEGAKASPPLVQWTGAHSKRTEKGFLLIRDDAAWRKLWAEHSGQETGAEFSMARHVAPKIDFERCLVVAYFGGRRVNQDGAVAEAVEDVGGAVRVRFERSTFQTAGPDERGGAQDVTPFAVWVIPATDKAVVIEEAKRSLKNEPVRWEEVTRFPGR